jgi:hypothetical protein
VEDGPVALGEVTVLGTVEAPLAALHLLRHRILPPTVPAPVLIMIYFLGEKGSARLTAGTAGILYRLTSWMMVPYSTRVASAAPRPDSTSEGSSWGLTQTCGNSLKISCAPATGEEKEKSGLGRNA